jgi:hypothetical protein
MYAKQKTLISKFNKPYSCAQGPLLTIFTETFTKMNFSGRTVQMPTLVSELRENLPKMFMRPHFPENG